MRLISMFSSEMLKLNREELKNAIKSSESRVILSENIVSYRGPGEVITNSEIARAFGADLILLNFFDVFKKEIYGLDNTEDPIRELKKLVGRPIGVNLEPVSSGENAFDEIISIENGRMATTETIQELDKLGFDFVCFTGNPKTGVSNENILKAVCEAKKHFSGLIIAGKMHSSGIDEKLVSLEFTKKLVESGADVILLPCVYTAPSVRREEIIEIVDYAHSKNVLVMGTIGTSQESSPESVIRQIALTNKEIGIDIFHIGDAGYGGISNYLNILELSRAIRGDRHTIRIISSSINR